MNVFDWIFIAALALGLVIGIIKGFLKPLFSAIGFVVVVFGTSFLAPVVQGWMMGIEMGDALRPLLAIILSFVLLFIIWIVISVILRKVLTARKGMGIINRVIGAVLGMLIAYLFFAVIISYFVSLGGLTPSITDKFLPDIEASWIRNHIYTDKGNFFGNWVINGLARRLNDIIQGHQPEAAAIVSFFKNLIV